MSSAMYTGEDGGEASSEDEDLFEGRTCTRDELIERDKKWALITTFEQLRAKTVATVLHPSHRGFSRTVRPREGAKVVVSYSIPQGGGALLARVREVVTLDGTSELSRHGLEAEVLSMRRGEIVSVATKDGFKATLELHCVRDKRLVAPNHTTKKWCAAGLVDGVARRRRLSLRHDHASEERSARRPRFGDIVVLRMARSEKELASVERIRIVLGAPNGLSEGIEAAVLASKPGEKSKVATTGEFSLQEADCINDCINEATLRQVEFCFLELESMTTPADGGDLLTAQEVDDLSVAGLKRRGTALCGAKRWRRAEALFSRAAVQLAEDVNAGPMWDNSALLVRLLLNIALCANKRLAPRDEDSALTRALSLLSKAPSRREPEYTDLYRKLHLRRASANIDLELWDAAEADLRITLGPEAAPDALAKDAQRQLRRLQAARAAAAKEATWAQGLSRQADDFTDRPLLYEAEIDARAKAQRPWAHADPDALPRAPRQTPAGPAQMREDDMASQILDLETQERESEDMAGMLQRSLHMHQMYDTYGTGKRNAKAPPGYFAQPPR
ncbi:hypothetical protein M885DRAFT_610555 [Pelagophyceae sp. CCMP2097]|nr:hypothetical protein M885DRAFT_610555 [Pelagophyceae sp. CCMP2097]